MTEILKRDQIKKYNKWWYFTLKKNNTYDLTFLEISAPFAKYYVDVNSFEVTKAGNHNDPMPTYVYKKVLKMLKK